MVVTTQAEVCQSVAKRWYECYKGSIEHRPQNGDTIFITPTGFKLRPKKDIYEDLLALKGKGTKAQIDEIIGNDSWTTLRCDNCKQEVEAVITVGEAPDYESATASLCYSCAHLAYLMIDKITK